MENIDETVQENKNIDLSKVVFQTTPVWKVVYLSIITCGIYEIIFFYKMWKTLAVQGGYKVSPFWRAIFSIFTNFCLFSICEKYFKIYDSKEFYGVIYAIIYLILSALTNTPDPYWLISFATAFIIAEIQAEINKVNANNFQDAPINNWNLANTLWAIPFTLLMLYGIINMFLSKV